VNGVAAATPHRRAVDFDTLDEAVYEGKDSYATVCDPALTFEWLAAAAERHMAGSDVFRRLAEARGFTPEALRETRDLSSIPVLSSGLFKRKTLMSAPVGPVRHTTSSGTRGSKSVVARDDRTLERFVGTVLHGLREFHGESSVREGFVLSPRESRPDGVWLSYVLTLIDYAYDTSFFVDETGLRCEALAAALRQLEPNAQPVIVGPPALVWELLLWMEEAHVTLDLGAQDAVVLTAGGWKMREGTSVSRDELTTRIGDRLGIPAVSVRDVYNMVELNTVLFECEAHRKHVPPWLVATTRRPSDLSIAEAGEEGILAFFDPTALSYPAFVLTDDFGVVEQGRCACGRTGSTLTMTRRIAAIEERGCGLSLERHGRPNQVSQGQ
jgi:long-chain-fatty-acid---luciferin-component ligase